MIEKHVRSILGSDGDITSGVGNCLEVAPRSEKECALLLAAASDHGWRVRIVGNGTWIEPDSPADLALSTRNLSGVAEIFPADLLVTAYAGSTLAELQTAAAAHGAWIALDPPGNGRTIGSILATGTAGPLRTGLGPVKAQILGLTIVTADGRIVRVGGRVVKNVAGFDLTSLAIGSFGAFGLITSANVRLSALPSADKTILANGPRDRLIADARAVLALGISPATLELCSAPQGSSNDWSLAIRSVGSETTVSADETSVKQAVSGVELRVLQHEEANSFWGAVSKISVTHPTTIRMGCLPSHLQDGLELIESMLDGTEGAFATVSVLNGAVRWSSDVPAEKIQGFRRAAAARGWPVTVERAPWDLLSAVGHFGGYRNGVGKIVESLRSTFDKKGALLAPLSGAE